MSKQDKLKQAIERLGDITFEQARRFLLERGFLERVAGSHHSFSKAGVQTITIKYRNPIHKDAVRDIKRVLSYVD